MYRDSTIRVDKTKALISFVVTAKLICVFVFPYAKCCFSHDTAQFIVATLKHIHIYHRLMPQKLLKMQTIFLTVKTQLAVSSGSALFVHSFSKTRFI